jgi:hypothetical protein
MGGRGERGRRQGQTIEIRHASDDKEILIAEGETGGERRERQRAASTVAIRIVDEIAGHRIVDDAIVGILQETGRMKRRTGTPVTSPGSYECR